MAVKVSRQADKSGKKRGTSAIRGRRALRPCKLIRKTNPLAPPMVIVAKVRAARKILVFVFLVWSSLASATTYYVSSSTGSDANSGTSSAAAWQTIAHVNGQTFNPGDSVLFKRGDVWNESLAPASSGTSGNPIAFDAYGTGAAPNLTGYYAVPATAWVFVTGNAWKAVVPSTYTAINFCLFGSVWGQKVSAVSSNLTAWGNFYLASGFVYVYSQGNPATYYNEPIVPMALSNVPVINVNGQSWLAFQHFLVNWFDQYGVYVEGTSDHLVFANMEADSMIPQGTQPLGFYVNESAPGPGDIKIYNSEAHLNYDGFRFDGTATAITMVNDKGYANRDGALVDNTGAVTYSYCHFYASSLAVAGSTDVEWTSRSGPIAGAGNIAADTAPAVQVYQRYPAEVTLTVDDEGMTPGADTYYSGTVLPVADAAGVPVGAAITVGYPLAQTLIAEFQGWVNAGRDVASHSISHTYYTNTDALDIQYTGSGTAAALSISSKILTITVTGASDSVSYNMAQGDAQGTMLGLAEALAATGKYTYSFPTPCQGPYGTGCSAYTAAALLSQDLADVSGQDVKSSVYHMQLNVTRLTTDEITLSRQWMTTNLTGLPATPVYVYPGGYETTAMQGISEAVPYAGARGALKEDLGVKDTYADGFNVENITSFGVNPSWMGLPPSSLNQKIQALVWKESVWGVPWGIFWHLNELTQDDPVGGTEITNLIQDFKNSGATIRTNTGLVNWLLSGTQETGTDGNDYYTFPATSMTLDFRPTKNSPVVDAGQNLGAGYELDINGVNQNSYGSGWEIGAHVYQGYATYGEAAGTGKFTIGTAANLVSARLPQVWVNSYEGDLLFSYELSLPSTWVTAAAPGCTFHTPYWTGSPTSAGLQSAINDIEACRTATGAGMKLDIPPALYTSADGIVIPQTSNTVASNFLILASTVDSSLPNGTTVCSHGIQDNLATSTDIGIDNPDCAGDVMYYQLGTTVTTIPAGAFTLANGVATNTSSYDDVQYMWTVESSGVSQDALKTCSPVGASSTSNPPACVSTTIAPDHWLIEDAEVRIQAGQTNGAAIVSQAFTNSETSTAMLPTHMHYRKVWAHSDWTSLGAGLNSISNAFSLSCVYCSVVDSQASQLLRPGAEGHVIWTAYGTQLKINHNWLEGQSSCVFGGGFTNPPSMGTTYVSHQDVEMRRNRCTFPYAWLGQNPISGNAHWNGQNITRKNIQELKEGQRELLDGNILENADSSGGQSGPQLAFNIRNSSAGVYGTNYAAIISDVTVTNNILRNTCEGIQIARSGPLGAGQGVSYAFMRGLFANNLAYNYYSTNVGCVGANSSGVSLNTAGEQWQGTVTENASGTGATFVANCSVDYGQCIGQIASGSVVSGGTGCVAGNLTIGAPNLATSGGIQATGTYTCSGGALNTITITNNGTGYASTPTCAIATGTGTCSLTVNASSTGLSTATGYQVLDIATGDPVAITMCNSVTAFNVPMASYSGHYQPSGIGPRASSGSAAWNGTFATAGVTVSYPWTATASASDSSGYCTISYVQGSPQSIQFTHNTTITNATNALTSSNNASVGPNRQINMLFQNDLMLGGGWFTPGPGEGTATETFNYDVTTMTANYLVWPTRTASKYTEYGNNPFAPASTCTGGGCSPPNTMYFPATPYCTGSTSSSACVGFVGAMSASSMPLTLADYHNFALRSDSVFFAGGSEQASDGSNMGANIAALDAAQTQNLYVCATACGSPGPYADSLAPSVAAMFFGFTETDTAADNWPTVNYGMQRFWDSPPLQWPSLNTASGVFNFSSLDTILAQDYSNGVVEGMYTLARTPPWASSVPSDASCNYSGSSPGDGDGECDPPSDLSSNGSGTNAMWKAWVTAIATHVNSAGYTATHAHIKYWEIWNEPDTQPFWAGSIAQLARLTEDANCIITGRGVIHESGNGSATACTATAIDATAQIVMASAHAKTVALTYGQNELYCNNTSGIPSYELPCPNPANAIASAVDIINFHMKPGNETGDACPSPILCTPESAMQWYVANVHGILQPAELAKPLWDGEAAYSTSGFTNAYTDADMAASFMPRFYLINWSLGISGMAWYTWDELDAEPAEVQTAYQQAYNWISGASLTTPCAATGTVWSCGIVKSGKQYVILWDTSQSCSGGSCTTGNQTVAAQWLHYQDMTTASTPIAISGHSVPVGIKPVVLS
jgi:hypothetical protein